MISGSDDGSIKVCSLDQTEAKTQVLNLYKHSDAVLSLALLNGKYLVAGAFDSNIMVWDLTRGAFIQNLTRHKSRVSSLAVSSDNTKLISGSFDSSIKIWTIIPGWIFSPFFDPKNFFGQKNVKISFPERINADKWEILSV